MKRYGKRIITETRLPQGGAPLLIIQYQMLSPKDINNGATLNGLRKVCDVGVDCCSPHFLRLSQLNQELTDIASILREIPTSVFLELDLQVDCYTTWDLHEFQRSELWPANYFYP